MGKRRACKKCKNTITKSNKPFYMNKFKSPRFYKICNNCLISQRKKKTKVLPIKQRINNPYDDLYNPNKDKYNEKFIDYLGNKKLNKNDCIIALDGKIRRTTTFLVNNGVDKDNILLIEKDKDLAKDHRENGVPCHNDTIDSFVDDKYTNEYADTYWKYNYRAFNFDTCGHVDKQGDQILKLLTSEKINFCDEVTLSCTFDKRLRRKGATFDIEYKKFIRRIKTYFTSIGFNIDKPFKESYYGKDNVKSVHNCNMHFTILNLSKHNFSHDKVYNIKYYYDKLLQDKKIKYKEYIMKKYPDIFSLIFS